MKQELVKSNLKKFLITQVAFSLLFGLSAIMYLNHFYHLVDAGQKNLANLVASGATGATIGILVCLIPWITILTVTKRILSYPVLSGIFVAAITVSIPMIVWYSQFQKLGRV
jgi:hypothetical protein